MRESEQIYSVNDFIGFVNALECFSCYTTGTRSEYIPFCRNDKPLLIEYIRTKIWENPAVTYNYIGVIDDGLFYQIYLVKDSQSTEEMVHGTCICKISKQ